MAAGDKSRGNLTAGLMVHAVDLQGFTAGQACQQSSGNHLDFVRWDHIVKGLGMGNGKILWKLAWNVLLDISAQCYIQKLDAAADAQNRFAGFHDQF